MSDLTKFKGKFQEACESGSHSYRWWSFKHPTIPWSQHCKCRVCKEWQVEQNMPPCPCEKCEKKRNDSK